MQWVIFFWFSLLFGWYIHYMFYIHFEGYWKRNINHQIKFAKPTHFLLWLEKQTALDLTPLIFSAWCSCEQVKDNAAVPCRRNFNLQHLATRSSFNILGIRETSPFNDFSRRFCFYIFRFYSCKRKLAIFQCNFVVQSWGSSKKSGWRAVHWISACDEFQHSDGA